MKRKKILFNQNKYWKSKNKNVKKIKNKIIFQK